MLDTGGGAVVAAAESALGSMVDRVLLGPIRTPKTRNWESGPSTSRRNWAVCDWAEGCEGSILVST